LLQGSQQHGDMMMRLMAVMGSDAGTNCKP